MIIWPQHAILLLASPLTLIVRKWLQNVQMVWLFNAVMIKALGNHLWTNFQVPKMCLVTARGRVVQYFTASGSTLHSIRYPFQGHHDHTIKWPVVIQGLPVIAITTEAYSKGYNWAMKLIFEHCCRFEWLLTEWWDLRATCRNEIQTNNKWFNLGLHLFV